MKTGLEFSKKFSQLSIVFNIPFVEKTFRFYVQLYPSPKQLTTGLSARCEDSRYVLFFDFDDLEQIDVEREILFLQKWFKLGTFYLFQLDRKNSFHAISLDKFNLRSAYKILRESSADMAFTDSPKYFIGRSWVLRIDEKGNRAAPKFLKLFPSEWDNREKSTAHKIFLETWYGAPKQHFFHEDGLTSIPIVRYSTGNRIK